MATLGEKYQRLRDFLKGSFRPRELEIFLTMNGYAAVVDAVPRTTAGAEYFFDVVQALDHRGLIDGEFFERLAQERPRKQSQIKRLGELWLDQEPTSAEPAAPRTAGLARPEPVRALERPDEIVNSIGMKLKLIPAGEFEMGSTEAEDERPRHLVTITRPFYLGVYPVTQREYLQVIKQNPSYSSGNERLPVENVSWHDAVTFCNVLSQKEGLPLFYAINGRTVTVSNWNGPGYRLPTEAEWEYACRAGTTTRFSFGDDQNALGEYAWFGDNANQQTHPVGEKKPNGFGLHDMHGNVWEWCSDWYDADYYKQSPAADPRGPEPAAHRVIRGGSWYRDLQIARSASRFWSSQEGQYFHLGFRLARGQFGR
jgi:formylglycine-generating enzyme required for sulfatase activity